MKKVLVLSLLTVCVIASTASADHRRGRGRWNKRHGGWRANATVVVTTPRVRVVEPRVIVRPARSRVVRRPIYVQRPVINVRYRDYDHCPSALAENYASMDGYYWVNGQWQWNGYEWIWQPGHYQPDPAYDRYYDGQPYAQPSSSGYYDGQPYAQPSSSGYYDGQPYAQPSSSGYYDGQPYAQPSSSGYYDSYGNWD